MSGISCWMGASGYTRVQRGVEVKEGKIVAKRWQVVFGCQFHFPVYYDSMESSRIPNCSVLLDIISHHSVAERWHIRIYIVHSRRASRGGTHMKDRVVFSGVFQTYDVYSIAISGPTRNHLHPLHVLDTYLRPNIEQGRHFYIIL